MRWFPQSCLGCRSIYVNLQSLTCFGSAWRTIRVRVHLEIHPIQSDKSGGTSRTSRSTLSDKAPIQLMPLPRDEEKVCKQSNWQDRRDPSSSYKSLGYPTISDILVPICIIQTDMVFWWSHLSIYLPFASSYITSTIILSLSTSFLYTSSTNIQNCRYIGTISFWSR